MWATLIFCFELFISITMSQERQKSNFRIQETEIKLIEFIRLHKIKRRERPKMNGHIHIVISNNHIIDDDYQGFKY